MPEPLSQPGQSGHCTDDLAYMNKHAEPGEFNYDPDLRDKAVEIVDLRHGYSIEYSASPGSHAAEYDEEEVRLHEVARTSRDRQP